MVIGDLDIEETFIAHEFSGDGIQKILAGCQRRVEFDGKFGKKNDHVVKRHAHFAQHQPRLRGGLNEKHRRHGFDVGIFLAAEKPFGSGDIFDGGKTFIFFEMDDAVDH